MTRLTSDAAGVYVIAVTPFHPDGRIDMESCDRMVDFYLDAGATGLTVLGMMGEAPKLTIEESRDVVARILARVNGRLPVVVGVSAPGFAQIDTLTRMVMDLGAAGVMVAPPGSLRTDDQIVTYYQQVADVLGDVPFVLQDFPLVTGVQISPKVIARIFNDLPTCVCLKHEDWPGLEKITALRAAARTVAPSAASDLAIAMPRPRLAPSTSARFPVSSRSISRSPSVGGPAARQGDPPRRGFVATARRQDGAACHGR